MTNDTDFTISLFDNTALSGWSPHTMQAIAGSDESDLDDAERAGTDMDGDAPPPATDPAARGNNFRLIGDRALARGWTARARDNIAAIILSKELEQSGRAPTTDEQARLLRFVGFGATELAQNCFRRPGENAFRPGWQEIGKKGKKVRSLLVKQQTMLANAIRGLATEFGVTAPKGIGKLGELMTLVDTDETIPERARRAVKELHDQCDRLDDSIEIMEAQIVAHARRDESARRWPRIAWALMARNEVCHLKGRLVTSAKAVA